MAKTKQTEFEWDKYEQSFDKENDDPVTQSHRELLRRNWLAHSIDIALGLENYNTIHFIKEMDTGKQWLGIWALRTEGALKQ